MLQQAARFSYLGIFFGVAVVIGYFAGHWVERRWGGAPWPSLVGVLIGITSGLRELFRVASAYKREH
jgi:F0F1-type ATP synthase assembly protein I